MPLYKTSTQAITHLSSVLKQQMCDLYFAHYEGSDQARFFADLEAKNDVILLYHQDILVGFTTLQNFLRDCPEDFTPLNPYQNAKQLRILFSGDTIVAPKHWGQQALAFSWIEYLGKIKKRHPNEPLYWFLLVKGFRTYKYLSAFGHSYYPHWQNNRDDLHPLLQKLAEEKYGDLYNVETGVVECPSDFGYLNHDLGTPSIKDLSHQATAFFLQKNPNFSQGHELACLCELEADNMKPLTKRLFLKGMQTPDE